jgi:hypothetical protein
VTTINLPPGHYRLSLGSRLHLDGDIAIVGGRSDPSQTIIDAALHSRDLLTKGTARLSRLTVTGGRAAQPGPAGAPGGGIDNEGTLALSNVDVAGNASGDGARGRDGATAGTCTAGTDGGHGGDGGGVFNHGRLTMMRVTVSGNQTGDGGSGGDGGARTGAGQTGCPGGDGAGAGSGAGVYSDGPLAVIQSTITGNTTGNGGAGGAGGQATFGGTGGSGGSGGDGAGIASSLRNEALTLDRAGRGDRGGAAGPRVSPCRADSPGYGEGAKSLGSIPGVKGQLGL